LKLREEYPFLREESTPQELKALVTDKITAWYILNMKKQGD
jgi:hypothetical protein